MTNTTNNTCRQFARILGGDILSSTDTSCAVTLNRSLNVTVLGRATTSPLVLAAMFSFEAADDQGRTLNLGETPILPREVNPFIDVLRSNNITVTALHNNWLFERPRLMYIHFEAASDPLVFARAVAAAMDTLTSSDPD